MKKIFRRFPFLFRIVLAVLLGFAAVVLSGLVYKFLPIKSYFPFVGEALLIGVTWILYRTDGENLSAIGLQPSLRNLTFLFIGLFIGISAFFVVTWLRTLYTGEAWHLSSTVDAVALAKSLYWMLPTVMVQELMFRGYLFTKTISRYGVVWANVVFASLFMLVHVLDRDVLRNPSQLIVLAITIPVGHLWFATALLCSKTILFPIGLHWGNNWAVVHLFGTTNNKQTFFYLTDQKPFTTWPAFVIGLLIFNVFFLLLTWITWRTKWSFTSVKIV